MASLTGAPAAHHSTFATGNINYYIHQNRAYTEDHVLVYNLFVHNIPRASAAALKKYFSVFGRVDEVSVLAKKTTKGHSAVRAGFVYFHEPLDAATALQACFHTINGRRFTVRAADSWRQPVSFATNTETVQDALSGTGGVQFSDLNDDCLRHICQLLELRDQVSLARSCNRCASIFAHCARLEQKVFALDRIKSMTLWEQREFFSLAGLYIETISGSLPMRNRERIVHYMSKFCSNTKSVIIVSCCIKNGSLDRLYGKLRSITELVLDGGQFNDNAILSIIKLPNLKTLSLAGNYHLDGKHLNKLTTVQHLNLQRCGNLQSNYVIKMVEALVDLLTLNLQGCFFRPDVYRSMATHSLKLATLKVSANIGDWQLVASIPNVKSLEIISGISSEPIVEVMSLFDALVHYKADKLEHLKIVAKNTINLSSAAKLSLLKRLKVLVCNNNQQLDDECLRSLSDLQSLQQIDIGKSPLISNDGLLYLLKNCQQLNCVDITFCAKIDDNFVHKAIKLLRMTREEHSTPVHFIVGGTAINRSLLQNAEYLQAVDGNIITLSFHTAGTMPDNNDV